MTRLFPTSLSASTTLVALAGPFWMCWAFSALKVADLILLLATNCMVLVSLEIAVMDLIRARTGVWRKKEEEGMLELLQGQYYYR